MSPNDLEPISTTPGDELSLRSCATEVFRWVRSAVDLVEQTPAYVQSVAHDLEQAWRDSAKR
jgi:hypothetical protein